MVRSIFYIERHSITAQISRRCTQTSYIQI